MGRTKGTHKTGGRVAGTPNKITGTLRDFVAILIDSNREQMEADLASLEPKERLLILEKLMQYVLPKQREMEVELKRDTETAEKEEFEKDLKDVPDDVLKAFVDSLQDARHKRHMAESKTTQRMFK